MSRAGDITLWVRLLRARDSIAAQRLWEAYFQSLVRLARRALAGVPRPGADEEDVALSAFDSFCRGAAAGRFPRLEDRHDLWQLLVLITRRKAADLVAHNNRIKRDWRRLAADAEAEVAALVSRELDPAFAAQVGEEFRRLLSLLPDDGLRRVALLKMEGKTNKEIATALDFSLASAERRLSLIREYWAEEWPG